MNLNVADKYVNYLYGDTPLQWAILKGIFQPLISKERIFSSLEFSLNFADDTNMVNFLIGHGANVNFTDEIKRTAFHLAAFNSNYKYN